MNWLLNTGCPERGYFNLEDYIFLTIKVKKGKAIPVTGCGGP
jgi:hypothetical protein